jgi:predicted MPP superfamily phosphohydrolase
MTWFRWLHLTDLHCGMSADPWLWPNISENFFEDLNDIHQKCGPFDAIFFSGDLVQQGSYEEYKSFDEILRKLYAHLNRLGSNPCLLTIPGNHDLVRPASSNPALHEVLAWSDHSAVPKEFWEGRSSATRRLIQASFRNYMRWYNNHSFPRPVNFRQGLLPGDFAASVEKEIYVLACSG